MSKTDKTSEIISSLNDYVERQKEVLDEENARLLKQGKESFEELIIEKQKNFSEAIVASSRKSSNWQAQAKKSFISVLGKSRKVFNYLRRKLKMKPRKQS